MALDLDRFVHEGTPRWQQLRELLDRLEGRGLRGASLEELRRLAELYRRTASDLLRARDADADPALAEALNELVARAHALLHAPRRSRRLPSLRRLLVDDFRETLHARRGALLLSAATLALGVAVGALATWAHPDAVAAFVPEGFAHDPGERVERDAAQGLSPLGRTPLASGAFLFTHNLRVTLLLFGMGLTWGVGVLGLLFYNGLLLGAMAADYAASGELVFFLAWVSPHGVPELTAVALGGAAGLTLAASLWRPGDRDRSEALREGARAGLRVLLGALPWLLVAGALEATVSQLHPPAVPYALKFGIAALGAVGVTLHLRGRRTGRRRYRSSAPSEESSSAQAAA